MNIMSVATFRTPGNATTQQNLFCLINTGTAVMVRILRIVFQVESTAVLVALMPLLKLCRISAYSGGQALTKVAWGAMASDATVVARGLNTSDGGVQTDIVATLGDTLWQQYGSRLASAAGQIVCDDQNIAPLVISDNPIVLRQGQGVLVYVDAIAGTVNPSSNHYFVQAVWGEVAT